MKLVIGNKNYSSWSLRPWLALRVAQIPFEEVRIPLYQPGSKARQLGYAPSGKVPVLIDGGLKIWDSLAIAEYLAERFPERGLWPAELGARAWARSISAEMHAGFAALRSQMPMNCRGHFPGCGQSDAVRAEIERIVSIWRECRERYAENGPFLFGAFSNADAFYAPVATRFLTYEVALPPVCRTYVDAVIALPAMQEWYAAAIVESERLEHSEPYATP